MAFRAPTMNLTCNIYTNAADYPTTPRLTGIDCQWRGVAKMTSLAFNTFLTSFSTPTEMILPAGTDVRSTFENGSTVFDIIELIVTGGTLAFRVADVYDVAKGFTNEYRIALCIKYGVWPIPIP